MPKHQVLILDDDEHWLARHQLRLLHAGIDCYATQHSQKAIEFAKRNGTTIAIIDEILFVPPFVNDQEGELQQWQGRGVVREIINLGLDTRFIFITSAPDKRSRLTDREFWQEYVSLKILTGVVEVIHKQEISHRPDDSYERIINLIHDFQQDAHKMRILNWQKTPFRKVFQPVKTWRIQVSLVLFNFSIDWKKIMPITNFLISNNNGLVNVDSPVTGDQIGVQHNYLPKQDLVSACQEIKAILDELSQTYPASTATEKQVFADEFKKKADQKPVLKAKIISALQSGGKETLKQLCSHPAVDIALAVYEGWQNPG